MDAAAGRAITLVEGLVRDIRQRIADQALAPGDVFSLSRSAGGFMRINVAQCADPAIFEVIAGALP